MTELETLRRKLDEIDRGIVALFEQRMTVSEEIGRLKQKSGMPVQDQKREAIVLQSRAAMCADENLREDIESLYERILEISRKRQTTLE